MYERLRHLPIERDAADAVPHEDTSHA